MIDNLDSIVTWVSSHPFISLFLSLCSFQIIEISPLKINPIQWVQKKIASAVKEIVYLANEEFSEKIDKEFENVKTDIETIQKTLDEYKVEVEEDKIKQRKKDAKQLRKLILDFYDSLIEQSSKGEIHKSKRSFEQILFGSYVEYEEILNELGLTNGLIDSAVQYIEEVYEELRRSNKFLPDEKTDNEIKALFNLEVKKQN